MLPLENVDCGGCQWGFRIAEGRSEGVVMRSRTSNSGASSSARLSKGAESTIGMSRVSDWFMCG